MPAARTSLALLAAPVALLAMATMPGCLVGGSSNTVTTGSTIPNTDIPDIVIGQTTGQDLLGRYGAPSTRIDRPDGTSTWRWCQTTTKNGGATVFLVLASSNSTVNTRCASIDLKDGIVTAVRGE
jgi:hypothetical protein